MKTKSHRRVITSGSTPFCLFSCVYDVDMMFIDVTGYNVDDYNVDGCYREQMLVLSFRCLK